MSVIFLFLLFAMAAVIVFDVTRFIIPNWLVGSLLVLYPVGVYLAPVHVDWPMALVAMLLVFAVGYVVFMRNWMGGGDIKLIIALSLWVGWGEKLVGFILCFGLLGGVLSVSLLVLRKIMPHITSSNKLPRILRDKEPVPYGVAIAASFLICLLGGNVPALPLVY